MTAYLIVYGKDPTDRFGAYSFTTREGAHSAGPAFVPSAPVDGSGNFKPNGVEYPGVGGCHYVIERDEDIPFNGPLMAAVYNALAGCAIKKFETRAIGIQRIMKALAEHAALIQPSEETEVSDMNTETSAVATPAKRGRAASIKGTDIVTVLVAENPKRKGSAIYDKFAKLMVSGETSTVAQANEIGFSNHDLIWDRNHDFLSITSAG